MSIILGAQLGMAFANSAIGFITGQNRQAQADKDIKAYQDKINNFQRQEMQNAYRNLTVPTKRLELMQEEQARTASTAINAAGMSGARGLASTVPQIMDYQTKAQNDISSFYEEQQSKIDQMIAQDDTNIRAMREQRDNQELQGLQTGLQGAMAAKQGGQDLAMGSLQSGMGAAGSFLTQYDTNQMYRELYGKKDKTTLDTGGDTPELPKTLSGRFPWQERE